MSRWLLSLCLVLVDAQLRPRRVGTNAMGDQEAVLTDVPTGSSGAGGAAADGGMAEAMQAMQAALGGEGGDFDPTALLKNMDFSNNPMMKAMADANPELAKMMSDPEALQEQMGKMMQMMSSPEGQEMTQNMMKEMQSVMTDPDKLKAGLEQLSTNPALKGLADAVPGLREVLNDPDALAEQASKAAELFQNLADPEKAGELKEQLASALGGEGGEVMENLQKMMGGIGNANGEGMEEIMQRMAKMMGGDSSADGESDEFGALDEGALDEGGGGDDLKARVREQMAQMMNKRRAAAIDEDEF